MRKHTPGPWKVYKGAVHPVLEDGVERNGHFAICGEMYGPNAPFNAVLIAAAPDLLDVAMMIVDANESDKYEHAMKIPTEFLDRIKKAIKKAKGE